MFKSFSKELLDCFTKLVKISDGHAKANDVALNELRDALAHERAERFSLQSINLNLERQLERTNASFDWLKAKVNQLEYERAALLQQVASVTLPVPELVQKPAPDLPDEGAFEDIGDDLAKVLHLDSFADRGDTPIS